MNFNSVKYLFSEGIKNLLNNILMAIASISVVTSCLLIVGLAFLSKENMKNVISYMGQQGSITIFLKDEAQKEQMDEFQNTLKNCSNVKSVEFITKDQARADYIKKFNDNTISEVLAQNNILPASINVYIKNVEKMEEILNIINDPKHLNIIIKTRIPTNFAKFIKGINKNAGILFTVLIIALISASLVIISSTIRAAVFARRREIAIMKQVGATDSFVRLPFFVEGAVIGVISAVLAFCLTGILYETVVIMLQKNSTNFLNSMFSTFISFKSVSIIIAISFLICGVLVGSLGSLISLRKYLKN